ncbi:MAG: acyltransferase [Muribaculaceae bacterium]|nr:acyltransferase [Muribaculaceae bacterium]
MANLSLTFRILRKIGLNYSEEEYGQVGPITVLKKAFANPYHALLQSMMDWVIFAPLAARKIRPWLLRRMGANVGKDVFIGDHCKFDLNHSDLITLEDHAHVASGTRLLCHQRDLSGYHVGDDYAKLGYRLAPVILKKGSLVGMESMVMPGVTIGEGAIVGAGSLISKDIPDWTIAVGRPAKVVKNIPQKE